MSTLRTTGRSKAPGATSHCSNFAAETGYYLQPPDVTDGFASHATDVWFSFNGTSGVLLEDENISYSIPFSVDERTLVDVMMSFWGSITKTGAPQGKWREFTNADVNASSVLRLDLGKNLAMHDLYLEDDCYFWESH